MYSGGLKDDKLNLLYNANSLLNVAIRRQNLETLKMWSYREMNLGPCFVQSMFGKEYIEDGKYTHLSIKYTR